MSVIEAGMVARHRRPVIDQETLARWRRGDELSARLDRYIARVELLGWGFVLGLMVAAVMV